MNFVFFLGNVYSCFNYSLELQRQKIDFQRALIRALAVLSLTWSPAEHEQIEFYRKKKVLSLSHSCEFGKYFRKSFSMTLFD